MPVIGPLAPERSNSFALVIMVAALRLVVVAEVKGLDARRRCAGGAHGPKVEGGRRGLAGVVEDERETRPLRVEPLDDEADRRLHGRFGREDAGTDARADRLERLHAPAAPDADPERAGVERPWPAALVLEREHELNLHLVGPHEALNSMRHACERLRRQAADLRDALHLELAEARGHRDAEWAGLRVCVHVRSARLEETEPEQPTA